MSIAIRCSSYPDHYHPVQYSKPGQECALQCVRDDTTCESPSPKVVMLDMESWTTLSKLVSTWMLVPQHTQAEAAAVPHLTSVHPVQAGRLLGSRVGCTQTKSLFHPRHPLSGSDIQTSQSVGQSIWKGWLNLDRLLQLLPSSLSLLDRNPSWVKPRKSNSPSFIQLGLCDVSLVSCSPRIKSWMLAVLPFIFSSSAYGQCEESASLHSVASDRNKAHRHNSNNNLVLKKCKWGKKSKLSSITFIKKYTELNCSFLLANFQFHS